MKILFFAAAAASFCFTAPVLAQTYATTPSPAVMPGQDIPMQLDSLRLRVKTGFDQGQLSHDETERLYKEIDRIGAVAHSDMGSGGHLDSHDRVELQGRIDGLSRSIHWKRAEGGAPPPMTDAAAPMAEAAPLPIAPASMAWTLDQREEWLSGRIEHGLDDHHLSGREVERGRQELSAIRAEQMHMTARDGGALSETDRSYLAHRVDELNTTLKWEGQNPMAPWMGM
jgi:hypothetical protein